MSRYRDDMRPGTRPQPIEQQIGEVKSNVRKSLLSDAPLQEKQVIDDSTLVSNDVNTMGAIKTVLILWAVMEYC